MTNLNDITIARDVIFLEKSSNVVDQIIQVPYDDTKEIDSVSIEKSSKKTSEQELSEESEAVDSNEEYCSVSEEDNEEVEDQKNEEPRRSQRQRKTPHWLSDYKINFMCDVNDDEPTTYAEAIKRYDSKNWQEAVKNEFKVLKDNNTWIEVDEANARNIIDSKFVFKIKKNDKGDNQYKARIVAKGFQQKDHIDDKDIYTPVAKLTTIRMFLCIANQLELPVFQSDVKGAFLYGDIEEDVFMRLPEGFNNKGKVCKLLKSLYGLKKSAKNWNLKFNSVMVNIGFKRSENDHCLYTKITKTSKTYVILYVDDILYFGNDKTEIQSLIEVLKRNFDIKDLGLATNFLGLNITQNIERGITVISQKHYLNNILIQYGMDECRGSSTPIDKNFDASILNIDKIEDLEIETKCRKLIGSLMYSAMGTRPDLCNTVMFLSRFQSVASQKLFKASLTKKM
ncbi:hypothetical protein TKK_0015453 [Trichogramma kaykai]